MVAAVLCATSQFALTLLILSVGFNLFSPQAAGSVKLVAFASTLLLPLLLAHALGLWRAVGLGFSEIRITPVFLASLLLCLLFLIMGIHRPEGGSLAADAGLQLVNAFGEELLFRGVIFALLLSLPRWQAVVLNGLLFGSMHLIHGYMDGNWAAALQQALATAAAGMMFAAVRYSTGSLWLVIVLHMLLNLAMIYSNLEFAAGADVLFVVQRIANAFELLLAAWVIARGGGRGAAGARHA